MLKIQTTSIKCYLLHVEQLSPELRFYKYKPIPERSVLLRCAFIPITGLRW